MFYSNNQANNIFLLLWGGTDLINLRLTRIAISTPQSPQALKSFAKGERSTRFRDGSGRFDYR